MLKIWQNKGLINHLLTPLSILYKYVIDKRASNISNKYISDKPIIVVGNLTVGGNGKTPLVRYLVNLFSSMELRVGVVSRGYKAKIKKATIVNIDHNSTDVGDEIRSLKLYCFNKENLKNVKIAIGIKRVDAVKLIEPHVDVIISDDGLQHYKMDRFIEILVINGKLRFGNGMLLPAGPLRESLSRVKTVDFIVNNGGPKHRFEHLMNMKTYGFSSVNNLKINSNEYNNIIDVEDFKKKYNNKIIAVAAIGYPKGFFDHLTSLGFIIEKELKFKDHHKFIENDIEHIIKNNPNNLPIIMTDKDAVKIADLYKKLNQCYYMVIDVEFDEELFSKEIKQRVLDFIKMKVN